MAAPHKIASTSAPVHELIGKRWSPRAFDPRPVEPEKLRSLFEAARWAASAYNDQPWFFIVATKDDPENFQRVLDCFVEFNQTWTRHAPVIALSAARLKFQHNGQPNRHAFYDVGQAAANLALQAAALGLQIHQMAGIHPEKAREIFGVPPDHEVVSGMALGYPGDPASLPDQLRERELAPRQRKPLDQFVYAGKWGQPSFITKP